MAAASLAHSLFQAAAHGRRHLLRAGNAGTPITHQQHSVLVSDREGRRCVPWKDVAAPEPSAHGGCRSPAQKAAITLAELSKIASSQLLIAIEIG
jgi:hypothetical protein